MQACARHRERDSARTLGGHNARPKPRVCADRASGACSHGRPPRALCRSHSRALCCPNCYTAMGHFAVGRDCRAAISWTNSRVISTQLLSGETLNGQRLIEFRLGQEADQSEGVSVASAELMVRAETSPRARHLRYTLWAFTVHGNATVGDLAGSVRRDPARGWQRIDLTSAARKWAKGGARQPLRLLLDCSGCAGRVRLRLGGGQAARPLLRLRLSPPPTRRRRALDCDADSQGRCCRQSYYVSFRALGWDDWIVAPEGYYANYCRGVCAPNYHSQVLEAARHERSACCAPVRFSALSLIYFGADSNIIKRDLPGMVVEECACP